MQAKGDSGQNDILKPNTAGAQLSADAATVLLNRLYYPILADDTIDFSKCINWEGTNAPPEIHEVLKNSLPLILEDTAAGTSVATLVSFRYIYIYLRRCQRVSSSHGGNNMSSSNLFYDYEKMKQLLPNDKKNLPRWQ